jgi:hypothetical protein
LSTQRYDLTRSNADFALVGSLAVSVRTEPRFTRDADFAVAVPGDGEAEALIRHLRARGYEVAALVEQEAVGRLATARLTVAGDARVQWFFALRSGTPRWTA